MQQKIRSLSTEQKDRLFFVFGAISLHVVAALMFLTWQGHNDRRLLEMVGLLSIWAGIFWLTAMRTPRQNIPTVNGVLTFAGMGHYIVYGFFKGYSWYSIVALSMTLFLFWILYPLILGHRVIEHEK